MFETETMNASQSVRSFNNLIFILNNAVLVLVLSKINTLIYILGLKILLSKSSIKFDNKKRLNFFFTVHNFYLRKNLSESFWFPFFCLFLFQFKTGLEI